MILLHDLPNSGAFIHFRGEQRFNSFWWNVFVMTVSHYSYVIVLVVLCILGGGTYDDYILLFSV